MRKLAGIILILLSIAAWAGAEGVFVKPVDGLPADFLFVADVSSVLSLEKSGVVFRGADGAPEDLFALLRAGGFTAVRARVWVDPYDSRGNSYGGGGCDTAALCAIGRRAAENGLGLIVDFHYSDFWADPKKQQCPKAWVGMDLAQKSDALYAYTKSTLNAVVSAGANVVMVQTGNETDSGMAGEKQFTAIMTLMSAGSRAIREVAPGALVAVHFSKPDARFARLLWSRNVDYDVYAVSYYPYWHGTLDNLEKVLAGVRAEYGKKTFIAETSYVYTPDNGDFQPNSVPSAGTLLNWAVTVQGQANALRAVTQSAVAAGALGWAYWEPAWLPVPGNTLEEQQALWEKYGSGWASSYAGEYDPADAGLYYGGSSWDNQALFDFTGRALPTLSLPAFCYTGSTAPRAVDSYSDAKATCLAGEQVTLPAVVAAVFNDGSTEDVPAAWNEAQIAAAQAAGLGEYTIDGTAGGAAVRCLLTITADNYVLNPGYEDTDMSMWAIDNIDGVTQQVYRAESINDIKSGKALLHFYSPEHVLFRVEQKITGLKAGSYDLSVYIQGGSVKTSDMYIYAMVDGKVWGTAAMGVTKWQEWQHPSITGIPVTNGEITIGAYVQADGAGPWGKLDDWMLNRSR
jgi:arabinogalactan endo-1,4-beta-galactosidase